MRPISDSKPLLTKSFLSFLFKCRGVILAENVTMVLSDKTGSVAATQRMIHKYVDPKRKGNGQHSFPSDAFSLLGLDAPPTCSPP